VFALNALCGVLPHDVKTKIAVEGVETFKNDISRNVRNALADIAGELIAKFLPEDWQETGKPGEVHIKQGELETERRRLKTKKVSYRIIRVFPFDRRCIKEQPVIQTGF
jgi:hypothetical protein